MTGCTIFAARRDTCARVDCAVGHYATETGCYVAPDKGKKGVIGGAGHKESILFTTLSGGGGDGLCSWCLPSHARLTT